MNNVLTRTVIKNNTWYFIEGSDYSALVFNKNTPTSYGWGYLENWSKSIDVGLAIRQEKVFTEATDEQVLERFEKELSERGFEKGYKFKSDTGGAFVYDGLKFNDSYIKRKDSNICAIGSGCLFENGNFATPILKPKSNITITQEELPKEMIVWGGHVKEIENIRRVVVAIDGENYICRSKFYDDSYHSFKNCKEI